MKDIHSLIIGLFFAVAGVAGSHMTANEALSIVTALIGASLTAAIAANAWMRFYLMWKLRKKIDLKSAKQIKRLLHLLEEETTTTP